MNLHTIIEFLRPKTPKAWAWMLIDITVGVCAGIAIGFGLWG